MNREELARQIERLESKTYLDEQFLTLLRDDRYPDLSVERWLDIKADYKLSLIERGICLNLLFNH